jgi:hypothetical protein
MQVRLQPASPPVLRKPDCLVWFAGDSCDQSIQNYNQILDQQQRQEWQGQVTVPLQKQIAEQGNQIAAQRQQIKLLELKLESQTAEALHSEARNQALLDGTGVVMGVGLAFIFAVGGFRRLVKTSRSLKDQQEPAASA